MIIYFAALVLPCMTFLVPPKTFSYCISTLRCKEEKRILQPVTVVEKNDESVQRALAEQGITWDELLYFRGEATREEIKKSYSCKNQSNADNLRTSNLSTEKNSSALRASERKRQNNKRSNNINSFSAVLKNSNQKQHRVGNINLTAKSLPNQCQSENSHMKKLLLIEQPSLQQKLKILKANGMAPSDSEYKRKREKALQNIRQKHDQKEQNRKPCIHITTQNITLQTMLTYLVDKIGFNDLYQQTNIRCFSFQPSLKSSLKALRVESMEWARKKLEYIYIIEKRKAVTIP